MKLRSVGIFQEQWVAPLLAPRLNPMCIYRRSGCSFLVALMIAPLYTHTHTHRTPLISTLKLDGTLLNFPHYKLTSNFAYKISKRKLNLRFLLPASCKQWTIRGVKEPCTAKSYEVFSLMLSSWCSIKEPLMRRWDDATASSNKNTTNTHALTARVRLLVQQCTCTRIIMCLQTEQRKKRTRIQKK